MATGAVPFDSFQVADMGDVAINPYHLLKSIDLIESFYDRALHNDVTPVSLGGDHLPGCRRK
jgi:guanidinobutyrase